MKYVIWGIGKRGTKFLEYIGCENIIAAIDSNPKVQGTKWKGLPVISIKDYFLDFTSFDIVITPEHNEDIISCLNDNHINNYLTLEEWFSREDPTSFVQADTKCIECFKLKYVIQKKKHPVFGMAHSTVVYPWNIFFSGKVLDGSVNHIPPPQDADVFISHGLSCNFFLLQWDRYILREKKDLIFTEDGFLRSIVPYDFTADFRYRVGHSFVMDNKGLYINAKRESALENMLNSAYELSVEEVHRAYALISRIKENKISKYNHQPIFSPQIGRAGKKKVLVVDQVCGDQSIKYGLADEKTFFTMLKTAMEENPDDDIIVKTHPASSKTHYNRDEWVSDRVCFVDYDINPYSLFEIVETVYVCTSQMGFEALMSGKNVHVFGLPFYAGWGATRDIQRCERRKRKRSVHEIFFFAYICYSVYVSYKSNTVCVIEDIVDELIDLRADYWKMLSRKEG